MHETQRMVNEIIGQCSRIIFLLTSLEYSALSRALFVLKMADGCAPDGRVVGALASAAQLLSAAAARGSGFEPYRRVVAQPLLPGVSVTVVKQERNELYMPVNEYMGDMGGN